MTAREASRLLKNVALASIMRCGISVCGNAGREAASLATSDLPATKVTACG